MLLKQCENVQIIQISDNIKHFFDIMNTYVKLGFFILCTSNTNFMTEKQNLCFEKNVLVLIEETLLLQVYNINALYYSSVIFSSL
jgi:hypothetical protein